MTKPAAVFLDSGIFIAFLDRSDRFHPAAVELFSHPPRRCHSSLAIVSETHGWFLHRLGEEAARVFRLALGDFTWLTLHRSTRRSTPPCSPGSSACEARRDEAAEAHARHRPVPTACPMDT